FHLVDEVERVLRRRWNARPRLDVPDHLQPEALREVRKRAVIGDDLHALVRRHHREPALLAFVYPPREVGEALVEECLVARPEPRQRSRNVAGHTLAVLGIEPEMGIAERMDISHRARDLALRDVEDSRVLRGVEIPVRAGLNLRVSTLLN